MIEVEYPHLRPHQSGSALLYVLIIVSVFSVLAVGGGATYQSLSQASVRDQVRFESSTLSDTITEVFKGTDDCDVMTNLQPAPTIGSEFGKAWRKTGPTDPNMVLYYPQIDTNPPRLFLGPGVKIGALTVANISISSVIPVNLNTLTFIAMIQVSFTNANSATFTPPSIEVPIYVILDPASQMPSICQATAYVATNQTIQDQICLSQNASTPRFDPSGGAPGGGGGNTCF